MNRYFTKRKAPKESIAQPKLELDLTTVLPPRDNFRTSLMMDSLSKRFSMLREQDDPLSMLGKASDDSVLAPRRQSRLIEYGYNPGWTLHDIAEVSSINKHVSPPFATPERCNSFDSDFGFPVDNEFSLGGSVMNRARPGRGNNLFGGRQKIYKIPITSLTNESATNSSQESEVTTQIGMKGRAIYEDDVSMSTFQRWRQKEYDRLAAVIALNGRPAIDGEGPIGLLHLSPSRPSSVLRHTSTSTTSTPSLGRISTAATSIASQAGAINAPISSMASQYSSHVGHPNSPGSERLTTKPRRHPDQIILKEVNEPHSGVLNSANSSLGNKFVSPPVLEGFRQGSQFPMSAQSPQVSPLFNQTFVNQIQPVAEISVSNEERQEINQSVNSHSEHTLISLISSTVLGKATGMGSLNKPQFIEKQCSERQMTLRRGPQHKCFAESPTIESTKVFMDTDCSDDHSLKTQSSVSYRSRAATLASRDGSWSNFSSFHNATNQLRTGPTKSVNVHEALSDSFPARDSSDCENGLQSNIQSPVKSAPTKSTVIKNTFPRFPPSEHEHPAFRSKHSNEQEYLHSSSASSTPSEPVGAHVDASSEANIELDDSRMTTVSDNSLGIENGELCWLIRQHLRQNSGGSSLNGDDDARSVHSSFQAASNLGSRSEHVGPQVHLKNSNTPTPTDDNQSWLSKTPYIQEIRPMELRDPSCLSPVNSVFSAYDDRDTSTNMGGTRCRDLPSVVDPIDALQWRANYQGLHTRGPSSDTIQEQDAFSSEIARRQRALQAKLKVKLEERFPPTATQEDRFLGGPFRGLEMLRTKSSREFMKRAVESPIPAKASKIFGLGSAISVSNAHEPSLIHDQWRTEEVINPSFAPSRSTSRPATSRSMAIRPSTLDNENGFAHSSEDPPSNDRIRKNSNPVSTVTPYNFSRSDSGQSNGRSRSRNGRFRDDLEKAMMQGTGSRGNTQIYSDSANILGDSAIPEIPNLDITQFNSPDPSNFVSNVQTSRKSSHVNGYFETKSWYSLNTSHNTSNGSSTISSPQSRMANHLASAGACQRSLLTPAQSVSHSGINQTRNPPAPFSGIATSPLSLSASATKKPNQTRSQSRKRLIQKSDIGEPRLISTTFDIDSVNLPARVMSRSGTEEATTSIPPVPSMSLLRRQLGSGQESSQDYYTSYPHNTSNNWYANDDSSTYKPRHRLRKSLSEGEKMGISPRGQSQSQTNRSMFGGQNTRPAMIEGGMF